MSSLIKEKYDYFEMIGGKSIALIVTVVLFSLPLSSCKRPNPNEPPHPKVVQVMQ